MKKYRLNVYGWEMDAQGFSLSNEQTQEIKDLIDDGGYDDLNDVRWDLEDYGVDVWDPNLFRHSAPFFNETTVFEIVDENGDTVTTFTIDDVSDLEEFLGDDAYEIDGKFIDSIPYEGVAENILLVVDENKGGLYFMEFESDEMPTAKNFSLIGGSVETLDGDWDFIDKIYYKGKELEIVDYLDNSGKAATIKLYTLDDL